MTVAADLQFFELANLAPQTIAQALGVTPQLALWSGLTGMQGSGIRQQTFAADLRRTLGGAIGTAAGERSCTVMVERDGSGAQASSRLNLRDASIASLDDVSAIIRARARLSAWDASDYDLTHDITPVTLIRVMGMAISGASAVDHVEFSAVTVNGIQDVPLNISIDPSDDDWFALLYHANMGQVDTIIAAGENSYGVLCSNGDQMALGGRSDHGPGTMNSLCYFRGGDCGGVPNDLGTGMFSRVQSLGVVVADNIRLNWVTAPAAPAACTLVVVKGVSAAIAFDNLPGDTTPKTVTTGLGTPVVGGVLFSQNKATQSSAGVPDTDNQNTVGWFTTTEQGVDSARSLDGAPSSDIASASARDAVYERYGGTDITAISGFPNGGEDVEITMELGATDTSVFGMLVFGEPAGGGGQVPFNRVPFAHRPFDHRAFDRQLFGSGGGFPGPNPPLPPLAGGWPAFVHYMAQSVAPGPVTLWPDQAASGFDLTEAVDPPTNIAGVLGVFPALRFDGVNNLLSNKGAISGIASGSQKELWSFSVVIPRSWTIGATFWSMDDGVGVARAGIRQVTATPQFEGFTQLGGTNVLQGKLGRPQLIIHKMEFAQAYLKLNGRAPQAVQNQGSDSSMEDLYMGQDPGGTNLAQIDVVEYLMYDIPINNDLSDADRDALEKYFLDKYFEGYPVPIVWLRADDPDSSFADGVGLVTWVNQGTEVADPTQNNVGDEPIYRADYNSTGFAALEFHQAGGNDFYDSPQMEDGLFVGEHTVIVAVNLDSGQDSDIVNKIQAGAASTAGELQLRIVSDGSILGGRSFGDVQSSTGLVPFNQWTVVAVRIRAAGASDTDFYVDKLTPNEQQTLNNAGNLQTKALWVGRMDTGSGFQNNTEGAIGEILLYDYALTDAQMSDAISAVAARYGITPAA